MFTACCGGFGCSANVPNGPGPHVQISRHLEGALKYVMRCYIQTLRAHTFRLRSALEARDLSRIICVLHPFVDLVVIPRDLRNLGGEESKALCEQTTLPYELFLQPSNLFPTMTSFMKEPL